MTSLVEIIRQMTNADGRATRELPRGLWLVYYPPAGEEPPRLIAARYLSTPSTIELQVVRDALLEALDTHPSHVVDDLDPEWRELPTRDGWDGYAITWHMLSTAGAFSRDADLRQRVRLALEQREQRALVRRRGQQRGRRPAADPGPEPML